jgi:endonuclease/exonuclease/phosphatase family metal-dependent hydrolase
MMRTLRAAIMVVAVSATVLVPTTVAEAHGGGGGGGHGKPVTVMTRNIYLGADINRPVQAALAAQQAGGSPAQIVTALANATQVTRDIVDRTDFPVRARLLAREIDRTEPDLIGLQEVALWRSGPLQLDQVGVPNATTVDYDYLQLLLDALARRGEHYRAVSVGDRADVESPSFTGSLVDGTIDLATARDVRLTMRDVVLMRVQRGLKVSDTGNAIYAHNLAIDVAGVTMRFDRGYQWVDVRAGSTRFRFINTHLESFSSDLAYAQAAELLGSATAPGRANVFVCDCNSDPLNHSVKTDIGDTLPHSAPYDLITGTGGFTDEWLQWAPAEQGWTSGLSELVNDPTPAGFDHRIDMVFGRTARGGPLHVDRGLVTGTRLCDRDRATGLWPSDHGGVVLRLRGL